MIRKVGVIYQDLTSLGFLRGLRDRLKCGAELVPAPTAMGEQKSITRRHARQAWRFFQNEGVDLVIRFTDADGADWQEVFRRERKQFPEQTASVLVCGVAVNNPEDWLCLNPDYLAKMLEMDRADLIDPIHKVGRVKNAITRIASQQGGKVEFVARRVRDAPSTVVRGWLNADDAFRQFYSDCRDAAKLQDCQTPNELDLAA